MKEIEYLGVCKTGEIDKRYGTESTASMSVFECPVCFKHYRLKTRLGNSRKTCKDCRGTQVATHRMSTHKAYMIWAGMKQRCYNPSTPAYQAYGAKGITVASDWHTFDGFWKDMGESYELGLTIDRIDSSKGYSKENCRWLTHSDNSSLTTKRRPVVQLRRVLVPTKGFVEERRWESAKQAADALGLVAAHITAVCQGQRKTHGGFGWNYLDQLDE